MENYKEPFQENEYYRPAPKRQLPNATTVLVLGIISIPSSFCYGIIGIILGIIALVLSKKDLQLYRENPSEYSGYENLSAGRTCAIIGLSLGSFVLICAIIYLVFIISMFSTFATAAAAGA